MDVTSPIEQPRAEDEESAARVLIVDDHPGLLMALAQTLKSRLPELDVETCETCREAMALLRVTDYDVVISDVSLPDGNGLEVLSHGRSIRPDCPVILVTGISEKDLALKALRGGAYDLIIKPVDPDYFAHCVERALERRRMRRELDQQQERLRRNAGELDRLVVERTRELREANRLKDEFLATVSHELRTPLTPILGWARLLRSPRLGQEVWAEAIESIERNARAQSQLIDDLLDVSRIVTGKLRLDVQPVDLQSVLDGAVEVVLPAARAKGIEINLKMSPDCEEQLAGDPQRLRQVFWNLLSNAVKFTKNGGRISVECDRQPEAVRIRVADTGCGIPAELLPFVFDRFRQGHGPGSRTGLGLGLAIVRHLVDLHGGCVEAKSDGHDRGTCFIVTLPVREANGRREQARSSMRPRHSETPPPSQCLNGVHILILEDTSDTRKVLSTTLQLAGARVTAVGNSAQAMDVVDRDPPHVMLCDIGLGDDNDDGYEFVKRVRARPEDRGGKIPAIALTALAKPEDRVQALNAGFQMHLPKPGPVNLPGLVARVVVSHRARAAASS